MSTHINIKLLDEIKILAKKAGYSVTDLQIIKMVNSLIKTVKDERDLDHELARNYEDYQITAVDEVLNDDGWKNYCSDLVWAGPDFIESQKRKGIIKEFNHYRFNKDKK